MVSPHPTLLLAMTQVMEFIGYISLAVIYILIGILSCCLCGLNSIWVYVYIYAYFHLCTHMDLYIYIYIYIYIYKYKGMKRVWKNMT